MIGGDITDELQSEEEVQRGLKKVFSHKFQDMKRYLTLAVQTNGTAQTAGVMRAFMVPKGCLPNQGITWG